MTPYYNHAGVTIYHGDTLEIMPEMRGVSAVVTDPPYSSGAHESAKRTKRAHVTPESVTARDIIHGDVMGTFGFMWFLRVWFRSVAACLVEGGHFATFIDWRMYPVLCAASESAGLRTNNVLVWNKGYPGLGNGFRAQHELVLLASRGSPAWHSYDYGNVLTDTRITDGEHPHQKPLGVTRALITTCTPTDGLVLDPFMGSGTTLVAAKALGRRAIGIEIEERYCEIAAKRLAQEVLPL